MFVLSSSMRMYKMVNIQVENDGRTIKEKVKNVIQNVAAKIKKYLHVRHQIVRLIRDSMSGV